MDDDALSVREHNVFPNCRTCPILASASAIECATCATATLPLPNEPTCEVCGQELITAGACSNRTCSSEDRAFGRVHVIAMYREPLARLIKDLKYNGPRSRGWAIIFGRIVLGYLEANQTLMRPYELIVPNPTFDDPHPLRCQHTELTLDAARRADFGWWPIDQDPWALTKTHATPSGAGQPWPVKEEHAQLHAAAIGIEVEEIEGKNVLVYDDLFTTGLQLHYVARRLVEHGAAHVDGLVLARAPWRPPAA